MRQVVVLIAVLGVCGCGGGGGETDAVEDRADVAEDVTDVAEDAVETTDDVGPVCGNGVMESGEECDLLDLDGRTCATLGHDAGGTLRCDATCHFDESWCRNPTCGDGACALGETATGCPADCRDGCGDGACAEAEDQFGCPADCGAVGIAMGEAHTCALLADRTVTCWGSNFLGQLGDGTYVAGGPARVLDLVNVREIAAGVYHTCALNSDGTVRCWGDGDDGALGCDRSELPGCPFGGFAFCTPVALSVTGVSGAVALASYSEGYSVARDRAATYALLSDGTVKRWGGLDPYGDFVLWTAVAMTASPGGVAITKGVHGAWLLHDDGTISCIGGFGCPCEFPCGDRSVRATAISGFGRGVCAVLRDGSLTCNDDLSAVVALSGGAQHACAVISDGTAACWGSSNTGALGDLSGMTHVVAVAVSGVDVSHEPYYSTRSCAALSDGTVWCWGLGSGEIPVPAAAW